MNGLHFRLDGRGQHFRFSLDSVTATAIQHDNQKVKGYKYILVHYYSRIP